MQQVGPNDGLYRRQIFLSLIKKTYHLLKASGAAKIVDMYNDNLTRSTHSLNELVGVWHLADIFL